VVDLRVEDGVAWLVLNRPSVGNALDLATATRLADAVEQAARDPDVRALVVAGGGAVFCVGGDVAAMAAAEDRAVFLTELAAAAHRAILALATFPQPVVVAVRGPAAGAGLALTLQGDVVVAGESSLFAPAYLGVGLTPDCGLSLLLPEVIGLRAAMDMVLHDRGVGAEKAVELGLAHELVGDDDVLTRAGELATGLARRPYPATGTARQLLRLEVADRLRARLDVEARAIALMSETQASRALIDSFVASRRRK
jgi:2-(1,2-epoxy-1,2-dihydrophenyl)acetyl-CoA isomerase